MADNPLIGTFDAGTVDRMAELLGQALRPIRVRLINRVGVDVPLTVRRCEFVQLHALRSRMMEEEVRLLARVTLRPARLPLLFGMDTGLLFRMVGMLMGEDPYGEPRPIDHRPFTRTDLRVARRLIDDMISGLEEGLPAAMPGHRLTVDQVTDDPYLDLSLPQTAGMIDAAIEVGDPDNPLGTAILALPTSVVQALLPDAVHTADPEKEQRGVARVLPIKVDAVAELGRVRMRLSELEDLQVGAVLPLGRPRTIQVRVRDRVSLIAEAGQSDDGVRCIRVVRNVHDLGQTA